MGAIEKLAAGLMRGRLPRLTLLAMLAAACFSVGSAQASQTHLFIKSFTPAGGFGFPLGVAINQSTEEVYVSDYFNGTVFAFEASGAQDPVHPRLTQAPPETEPFGFREPYGVAVDNSAQPTHGDIYVAQAGAGAVDQFSPAGVRTSQPPITLANIPENGTSQPPPLPNVANNGGFRPAGVAVTSGGDIYVADQSNSVVDLFEPNGTFISQLAAGDISGPNLIAVDGSGNLYVAQNGSGLLEFSPTGTCLNSCTPIDPAANLGVAIDPAGHILADEGGQISEYESNASLIERFGQPSSEPPFSGLSSSFDLAVNNTTGEVYAANFGNGNTSIFGPLVTLPDTTTGPPTNPGQTSGTMTGHVDPDSAHGGGPIEECRFEYGTDTSYGLGKLPCEPPAPLSAPTDVSAKLSGLSSETTYHYRLFTKNANGVAVGTDETFTPHSIAELETKPTSNVGSNHAQLNASFVGNGEDTHYYFEWGTDPSYGHSTALQDAGSPSGPAQTPLSFALSGLNSLGTYHYRVVAENSAGITRGQDQEFTTLQAVAAITTEAPTQVKATTATFNASFIGNGEDTHYYFEWGTEPSYGHTTPEVDAHSPSGPNPTQISSEVSGLDAFTTLHYRVVASNAGGTNYGGDQEFMTLPAPPSIAVEFVSKVHSDSALLHGQVNPENGDTTYHFEYGTGECSASSCTATPSVDIGSQPSPLSVSAQLGNLAPAITYHWRLVAESVGGITDGPDHTFTTFPFTPVLNDPCPNAHVRQQTGAALLPDCRAYELVSAANSGGYDVESSLVSGQEPYGGFPDANNPPSVLYGVHSGAIPGVGGDPTNRGVDPYVATRGDNGWSTRYVGIPASNQFSAEPFSSRPSGADASLSTLAFAAPGGCSPCFADGSTGIPVRLADGSLVQGMAGSLEPGPSAKPDGFIAKELSAGGGHLLFGSTSQFEPDGNGNGDVSIYDRNLNTGATHVVSKTPAGTNLPCLQGPGACHSPGDRNGIAELDISADGSHILLGQKVSTDAEGNVYWHLYMNIGDSGTTIDLTPGATDGVLYDGMTADGSKVFFTTKDQLAGGDDTDSSPDIYQAEVSGSTAILSRISTGIEGTGNTDSCEPVSNIVHAHWNTVGPEADCGAVAIGGGAGIASGDGTVYFLSPERLDGSSNGVQNAPNLYVARPGSPPHFVATLESSLTGSHPLVTFHPFLRHFGATPSPALLAVDHSGGPSDGDLYVYERSGELVYKFDPSGNPIKSWGNEGSMKSPLYNLGGLAVGGSTGTLYLHGGNCQMVEYNQDGSLKSQFGGVCGGPIAVDSTGNIYYGGGGGIAVDPSNNDLYFDNGGGTIERSVGGGPAEVFASGVGEVTGLAVDSAHNVYVDQSSKVVELDSTGSVVGLPIGSGLLAHSSGVAVNAAGDLFVGNPGRGHIDEFGPSEPDPLPQIVNPLVDDSVTSPSVRHTGDFQVTPDGNFAIFSSVLPLTGTETGGHSEIFRYDAGTQTLLCVSCGQTGVEPSGDSTMAADGSSLTNDGRVFFNSDEPLVESDGNSRGDVYEWESPGTVTGQGNYSCQNPHGCLALISTGISAFDSSLLSASSDGTDVNFFTRDKLVAQGETGSFVKLYDARELGGFPISPAPVPCKASDECHGPGSPPPPLPNIHLNTGNAGNQVAGSCKPGFRKKHGKCVKKPRSKRTRHHKRRHRHG